VVELGSPATPFQEQEEGRQKLIFNSTGLYTTRRPNGKQNGGSLTISLLSRSPIWHDTPNSYFRISPSDVSGRREREREETTPGETLQGRRPSHTDLAAVSFTFFVFLIFTIYLFIYLILIFLNLFLIPAVFVFLSASDLLKHGGNDYIFKFLFFYLLIFFIIFINRRNSLLKNR
jgi:hypothetical protein